MSKRTLLISLLAATLVIAMTSAVFALRPAAFQGKPNFSAGSNLGAFVWHNAQGLHVRFTTKGAPRHFTGKVCTPRQVNSVQGVRLEAGDSVTKGPQGHCAIFNFHTRGGIDGFDLRAPGGVVTFTFKMGGSALGKQHIWVGSAGVHPAHSPFVLNR